MDSTRRNLLDRLANGPMSGPALARDLGISRAAVWKQIESLRESGFDIEASPAGYVVRSVPEYGGAAVAFGLDVPFDVIYERSIPSTNDVAREQAAEGRSDVLILADEQPRGRGRMQRAWVGPSGGIYASLLFRPSLTPMDAPLLTLAAAVAVVEAIESVGVDATIKWPNDILAEGQKLAGILTEVEGEADRINWAIVGIGINANVDRSELPAGATSLAAIRGEAVERRRVVQQLVERVHAFNEQPNGILETWREHAETLGQEVRIETATGTVEGTAVDIAPPGNLVVDTREGRIRIHAGDCEHLRPAAER